MLPTKPAFKLNPFFCALLPLTMHGIAFAQVLPVPTSLPTGGQVVSGSAVITSGTDYNDTDFVHVAQSSSNVLINWTTFDIANGNLVQFDQPDAGSVAVNRVLSPSASFLDGALNSNGRVFVINPNGVLFGATSSVNVGGLLATTFDISEGNFSAGRFVFNGSAAGQGEYAGVVRNQGEINVGVDGRLSDCCIIIPNETDNGGSEFPGLPPIVSGGEVVAADVGPATPGVAVLAGRRVDNQGDINAFGGQIGLVSGSSLAISFDNGLISYEVTPRTIEAVNDLAAIRNSGNLSASGGSVTLLARASNTTPGVGILNSGAIRANGISVDGSGGVYLTSTGGSIESTGTIDASASECCFDDESDTSFYTPQAVRIESDSSVVIRAPVPSTNESFDGPAVISAQGPLINADAGGVPSAGTILIQGADVTLSDASILGSSQVRIVATSGDVTGGSGTTVSGSAVGVAAGGDVSLRGNYSSFINSEVPVVADLESALAPGSISIQGAAVAVNGASIDAATLARIVATTDGITSSPTSNVSGTSLDIQAAGDVALAGQFSTGKIIRGSEILIAPSKEGVTDPDGISIQGANVELNGVDISSAGPVRIAATAGDVYAVSSSNQVSGGALDIRATGSVELGGTYRAGAPLIDPDVIVASYDDAAPGTIFVQGADVVLDGVSIEAQNQVRIRATTGGIVGLPNDGFNDVYGSALDFQAAGSIQLSGSYRAGFDPGASLAFVDEASETGDVFIRGSEVVFNNASVTGSGEMRIIATSGNVSDIQVGGTSSTSNQITANALGIQAAGSILLSGSSLTVGTGETSIGGDPTIGDVLGVVERLQALYPPSAESASVTARADGVEIYDTSDSPSTPISPPIFVPNHQLPNASFVSGEGGVIRIGTLQMSGDYLFLQSDNPALQFSPTPFPLFIQLVAAGLGGSIAFEQNPAMTADLNLSPSFSFFPDIDDVNATLVFGSISNPGNVFVGQQGIVASDTDGFNYVLAAGAGALIFNPERLITPGEVVVLGQVARGGPRPPVDPPRGPDVLFPSPLPPGQTAEVIAARSEPVTRSASDLTFDVAAALDSSIQYNSAAGPILACQ